jgi:hypothetical protein
MFLDVNPAVRKSQKHICDIFLFFEICGILRLHSQPFGGGCSPLAVIEAVEDFGAGRRSVAKLDGRFQILSARITHTCRCSRFRAPLAALFVPWLLGLRNRFRGMHAAVRREFLASYATR